VARLRQAGAIARVPTCLTCCLPSSDNLMFGATCNPYDLGRTSGGSSGGGRR
jgi:Asp-tRNA(Asn)/Glu-tRNA(Gln) amidotransferase A subunit family amidase